MAPNVIEQFWVQLTIKCKKIAASPQGELNFCFEFASTAPQLNVKESFDNKFIIHASMP